MVPSLDRHILTVDANAIHKIDTANPESLFYIWTVFSRCAPSVEQGRRLENLSWRLWQRKTLASSASNTSLMSTSTPRSIRTESKMSDLPQLSGSVESAIDEEAVEFSSNSATDLKPRIRREDSCMHDSVQNLKQDDFEKMVVSILTETKPLSAPLPQIPSNLSATATTTPAPVISKPAPAPAPAIPTLRLSQHTTPSVVSPHVLDMQAAPPTAYIPTESIASPNTRKNITSTPQSSHIPTTIIHGFGSSSTSVPRDRLSTSANVEPLSIAPRSAIKKSARFTCGGSASSNEAGHSLSEQSSKQMPKPAIKRGVFQVGGSSVESSAHGSLAPPSLSQQKKQLSFSAVVDTIDQGNAIASDSDSDYYDDDDDYDSDFEDYEEDEQGNSAGGSGKKGEDDDDEWEDSCGESGRNSVDERDMFARVESKVNLRPNRSLITLMMNQNDPKNQRFNASRSTSALNHHAALRRPQEPPAQSGLSQLHNPTFSPGSSESSDEGALLMRGKAPAAAPPQRDTASQSRPQVTAPVEIAVPPPMPMPTGALSPRTTRKTMLDTELTESLRVYMLRERLQRIMTRNAGLTRRHTAHDMTNLKQYPQVPFMKNAAEEDREHWDRHLARTTAEGYHTKGW